MNKRRVRHLHELRSKWGDCYWKPGDDEHYPGEHRCEELEPDLIEFENDVRADFTTLLGAAPRAEGLHVDCESHGSSCDGDPLNIKRLELALTAADRAGAWNGDTPEDRLHNFAVGIAAEYARLSRPSDERVPESEERR